MNTHVSEADLIGGPQIVVTKAEAAAILAALDAAATMYLWISDEEAGVAEEDLDAIDRAMQAAHAITVGWKVPT